MSAWEFLGFLWDENAVEITYILWLLQTWYMLGVIVH
jgi:hypothetical protein